MIQAADTREVEQFGLPCQVGTVLCGYNDSITACGTCHQLNSVTDEYCDIISRNTIRIGGVPSGAPRIGATSPAARISVTRVHGKTISTVARLGFIAGSGRHLRFPMRCWASVRPEL